jgi:DNA excision repair protein ERCC-2
MDVNSTKKRLTLSVGELSRLVADVGESSPSVSLSLRGRLGAEAHRAWQDQRKGSPQGQAPQGQASSFRQEVHLDVCLPLRGLPGAAPDGWEIRVRGRLDGLIEELDRLVVEELKTVALPPGRFAALSPDDFPRHRRQVEIYLHLLVSARVDKPAAGRLVYLNLPTGKKKAFEIPYLRAEIEPMIQDVAASIIEREVRRAEERQVKRQTALQLRFPFPSMRPGQEEMIAAIRAALSERTSLLIEAPTGLGKTAAALFAALPYALEHDRQVMFLTSKTTQQDLVFTTARELRLNGRFRTSRNDLTGGHSGKDFSPRPESNPFPRTLLLRARQKICPMESSGLPPLKKGGHAGDQSKVQLLPPYQGGAGGDQEVAEPENCPYREDFFHRLRQSGALWELLEDGDVHPDRVREVGERERLCPHELQLLLAEEVDLIIGDYNYAFDPVVRLDRLFVSGDPGRLILIVDEAHNLPDRARSYYSPRFDWELVEAAARRLNEKGLHTFDEPIKAIQSYFEHYLREAPPQPEPMPIELSASAWLRIGEEFEAAVVPYWYSLSEPENSEEDPVLILQRSLEDFSRAVSLEGDNFAHLLRRSPVALEVLCLDAAPTLQESFDAVHSAICQSATLQPFDAYSRLLGLNKAETLALPSPFPTENLRVIIDPAVTTLYRERHANIDAIAARIQHVYDHERRNILAFFPSFEFMRKITGRLKVRKLILQEEGLSDRARADLLSSFKKSRHALLCSVMGGVFAEGIDLPGRLAEAAIIVGVGLPQVSTENELLRAYFERRENRGFEYAYLYPGMRRVIQAAGRVIRSKTDRGVILLLDRRYTQKEYQRLLPRHWYRTNPSELVDRDWQTREIFHAI